MNNIENCFTCSTKINLKEQQYYLLIGNSWNYYYCVPCYDKMINDLERLDKEVVPLFKEDFIMKNKK